MMVRIGCIASVFDDNDQPLLEDVGIRYKASFVFKTDEFDKSWRDSRHAECGFCAFGHVASGQRRFILPGIIEKAFNYNRLRAIFKITAIREHCHEYGRI
jgi:hypothetical protein